MKYKLSIIGLMAAFVMAAFIGGVTAEIAGNAGAGITAFLIAFGVPVLKPFFPAKWYGKDAGVALMAIQVEVWQNHIEGNLFKDNTFLLASTDASMYVEQGKIVHIPQAGVVANVEKSRSSLPASVSQRTDTDVTYELSPFTTDPILLPNAEKYELSYAKRESVLAEHETALNERVAEDFLRIWAPTAVGSILRTTGEGTEAHVDGTTGMRKKFVPADLKRAGTAMDKQNVAKTGRYCIMSADMYSQFTDALEATEYRDFSKTFDPVTGVMGMMYGFKVYVRSSVVVYNEDASAINAYGAAASATDNDAVLCWQVSAVERAVGSVTFFDKTNDPTYYGDVYSFEVRAGGRKRRADGKGVIAIVQEAASGV